MLLSIGRCVSLRSPPAIHLALSSDAETLARLYNIVDSCLCFDRSPSYLLRDGRGLGTSVRKRIRAMPYRGCALSHPKPDFEEVFRATRPKLLCTTICSPKPTLLIFASRQWCRVSVSSNVPFRGGALFSAILTKGGAQSLTGNMTSHNVCLSQPTTNIAVRY